MKDRLIVALDVKSFEEGRILIDKLGDKVSIYKVGSQIFTACGPVIIRYLEGLGKKVFLDLKWYDIPNTVAGALEAAVSLSVDPHDVVDDNQQKISVQRGLFMCTVHIQGGEDMMRRSVEVAKQKAEDFGFRRPLIVGITVLTSEPKQDNIQKLVLERAKLAQCLGLDGVVASSQEARVLRKTFGEDFVIVTPGIRLLDGDMGDQKRVTTPKDAIANGSSYLVVGRPIVKARDPRIAAEQILQEMNAA